MMALAMWALLGVASAHDPAVSTVQLLEVDAGWVVRVSVATEGVHQRLMESEPEFLQFDATRWKQALAQHTRSGLVVNTAEGAVELGPIAIRAGVHETTLVATLPPLRDDFDLTVGLLNLPGQTQVARVTPKSGDTHRRVLHADSAGTVAWPEDFGTATAQDTL